MVITYENRTSKSGVEYRLVTENPIELDSYLDAQNYLKEHPDKNMAIVGSNPFVNPVPIEAVTDYRLVFGSSNAFNISDDSTTSEVKVFQYLGK